VEDISCLKVCLFSLPANRWLSVRFYMELITDPEERGDFVPGGLLGEDACCFDIEKWDEDVLAYAEKRISESYENAARENFLQ